jgi:HSP20 family molecular chaperone IbpA
MNRELTNHQAPVEKTRAAERRLTPPVDIFENSDGFLIVADLPGVTAEGVSVEYNPPELHVSGRVNGESAQGTLIYERRFEVGSSVDPGSIEAELKHGVLRIRVRKSAALRPRRIDVKAA